MSDPSEYVLLERRLTDPIPRIAPPHGYHIRSFAQGDARVWTMIQNTVFEPHKAQDFHTAYGDDFSGEGFFFAQNGDESVGIAGGIIKRTPKDTPYGVVDWVGVLKEHRRQHIASSLVSRVLDYLRSLGLSHASLATPAYRENAIALYRKLDFVLISRDDKDRIDKLQITRETQREQNASRDELKPLTRAFKKDVDAILG